MLALPFDWTALLPLSAFLAGCSSQRFTGAATPLRLLGSALLFLLGAKAAASCLHANGMMLSASTIGLGVCALQVVVVRLATGGCWISPDEGRALAAHLGSISLSTYLVAEQVASVWYGVSPSLAPIALLLEAPPILLSFTLFPLSRQIKGERSLQRILLGHLCMPLFSGACFGLVLDAFGMAHSLQGLIHMLQWGLLLPFLLLAGQQARQEWPLQSFRQQMPLLRLALGVSVLGGVSAALLGAWQGLPPAELFLLSMLCASASYIAAPAAFGALGIGQQAQRSHALAIGMIFPWNLCVGLLGYSWLVSQLTGVRGA